MRDAWCSMWRAANGVWCAACGAWCVTSVTERARAGPASLATSRIPKSTSETYDNLILIQMDAHSGVCEIIAHPDWREAGLRHPTPDPHFNVGTAVGPLGALGWAIISQPANTPRWTQMGDYFAADPAPQTWPSTLTLGVRGRRWRLSPFCGWAIISQTPDPQPWSSPMQYARLSGTHL